MTIVTLVSGCYAYPGDGTRDGGGHGGRWVSSTPMAGGVSRHRLAVDATVGVIANPYKSAALRPPSGARPSRVPSGALRIPGQRVMAQSGIETV